MPHAALGGCARLQAQQEPWLRCGRAQAAGLPMTALTTWAKGYVRRGADRSEVTGDAVVTYLQAARH